MISLKCVWLGLNNFSACAQRWPWWPLTVASAAAAAAAATPAAAAATAPCRGGARLITLYPWAKHKYIIKSDR